MRVWVTSKRLTNIGLFLLMSLPCVSAQELTVTRVTAKLTRGISIEVSTKSSTVLFGKRVRVDLRITNLERAPIYLVQKEEPEFNSHNNRILVEAPLPIPTSHGRYDYSFAKIRPGSTFATHIDIPPTEFKELGVTRIFVGLGFVNDAKGIDRKLEEDEDPIKLRGPLANRIRTLGIGNLQIEVVRSGSR